LGSFTSSVLSVTARNMAKYLQGQAVRAAVRAIVADLVCPCCRNRPSAKAVLAKLPAEFKRDPRTINAHINGVLGEIAEKPRSVSVDAQ